MTLEGYAVEGGFDRPYEPATCFRPTLALGRHDGPGDAADLWRDYERVLDLVPGLGFDGVRLTVEWARIEPRRDEVDQTALERYARVAQHARSMGLDVTVALVDAAWPAWLGLEAWLLPWVRDVTVAHVQRTVRFLGDAVTGVVLFTQPHDLVAHGYLSATAPPWRRGATRDASFARAQLASIESMVRDDEVVGAKIVATSRTLSLTGSPAGIAAVRAASSDCDELYVRTLVKGAGPTSSPVGLLERRDGAWHRAVSDELLSALR